MFCVCVFLIWSNTFFFSVLVPDPFNITKNISIIFGLAQTQGRQAKVLIWLISLRAQIFEIISIYIKQFAAQTS